MEKTSLTVAEVATVLEESEQVVRLWLNRGVIRGFRPAIVARGSWRVAPQDLIDYALAAGYTPHRIAAVRAAICKLPLRHTLSSAASGAQMAQAR